MPIRNTAPAGTAPAAPWRHSDTVADQTMLPRAAWVRPKAASLANDTALEPSLTTESNSSTAACMAPAAPPPARATRPMATSSNPAARKAAPTATSSPRCQYQPAPTIATPAYMAAPARPEAATAAAAIPPSRNRLMLPTA